MRNFIAIAFVLLVSGCVSGYQQFYKSEIPENDIGNIEFLQPGEDPKVYGSKDFEKDTMTLFSKNYRRIGVSSFNGSFEDESKVKEQAKRVGASVVLIDSKYTNTQTTTSPLFLPNTSTTYISGFGGGATATTYGTMAVPITSHQRRFDQVAVFFAKSTEKLRLGVGLNDLTNEQRIDLERNTGAVITAIVDDSPAFNSNLLPEDVIIEVDGVGVKNAKHLQDIMKSMDISISSANFKIIRKHKEKEVDVKFK